MNASTHATEGSTHPEFITSTDIAAEFGVSSAAVSNWRRRYGPDSPTPFPSPEAGFPMPLWRRERWSEIHAWNETRGGHHPGVRKSSRKPREDHTYLSIQAIANHLNVTTGAVRQWLRKEWPTPFPPPEARSTSRNLLRWHADRLPDIQRWREWHLRYLATRSNSASSSAPDDDQSNADRTRSESAPPSPAHYVRERRSNSRSGVRQGRIVRPSVQRRVR